MVLVIVGAFDLNMLTVQKNTVRFYLNATDPKPL
jgi:hypothetical protein